MSDEKQARFEQAKREDQESEAVYELRHSTVHFDMDAYKILHTLCSEFGCDKIRRAVERICREGFWD